MPERFDAWRALMEKTICPQDMSSEHSGDFHAQTRLTELGAVRVWPSTIHPMRWRRTPRLIRRADPKFYHLSLPTAGTVRVSQAGHEGFHGPLQMCIVDTSRPYDCVSSRVRGIGLEVPKRLVPLSPDRVARLLTRRLSGRAGAGALLADFLTSLARQADTVRPCTQPGLERAIVDLLSATLAHHLDAEEHLPPEPRTRTLNRQIRTFIAQHLRDPDLTPRSIAAAHHISVGYLHQLFQDSGDSVAAVIRQQRLDGARQDLANPALRGLKIHDVAARWGFTYHSTFTRAFRTAYGHSPREHREQAAPTAPTPS